MAAQNQMQVEGVPVDDLAPRLIEFLRQHQCHKLALPASAFLDRLGVFDALQQAGFHVRRWEQITLDEIYDFDCGLTDVHAAVAETGSLVIRPAPGHGRALSLIPPIHVAIVEPKNLVGDLLDLLEKLCREGSANSTILITGPSKTADIEMTIVQGVHGPGLVKVFLLE